MKKRLLVLGLLIVSFFLTWSQQPITIVSGDMPMAGNVFYVNIDTIPSGLTPGPKGPNLFWDFSSLHADMKDTIKWMLPSATPYGSTFNANSNLAVTNNDTNYLYFHNSTTVFKATGAAMWFDTLQSVVLITFTGSNDIYRFPTTYNGRFTGTYGFTQDVTLNGNQIRIEFTSNYADTIDAWGIAQTPYGYYEVLRQKRVERTRTVIKAFPPFWVTVSDTRDTTTDYNFLAKDLRQVLVDFSFDTLGNPSRIVYATTLPKPIARFTYSGSGGNYTFTNTTYNTNGTSYSWNFGDGSPTSNAPNPTHTYTANGSYTVCLTATNAQGSSTFCQTIQVTGVCPNIIANLSITNASCGFADGAASVSPSGGASPYTFLWNTGQTTATITGLAAGAYTVIITDANGCSTSAIAQINNPGAPALSESHLPASCYAVCNGQINLYVSGGTSPYHFSWSNNATSEDISDLCAGLYTVTVTDASQCAAVISVEISQPDSIHLTAIVSSASSASAADGSIDLTVSGGTPPYNFEWSTGDRSEDLFNLPCGDYTVVVEDNNECFVTASYRVDCLVNLEQQTNPFSVRAYPNPSDRMIFLEFTNPTPLIIELYDMMGSLCSVYQLFHPDWLDLSGYPKGIYFLHMRHSGGYVTKKIILQ